MSKMPKRARERLERPVKDDVKAALDEFGWYWFMPPANMYGKSGISDILAIKAGVFLAIETKNKTGVTENQRGFLNSIRAEKGFGFVVNRPRVEHFKAFLGSFDRSVKAKMAGKEVAPEDGAMMLNAIKELTEEL